MKQFADQLFLLFIACCFGLLNITQAGTLQDPPEVGDGHDYDMIAFAINNGCGIGYNWSNDLWRQPYENYSNDDRYQLLLKRHGECTPDIYRPPLLPMILSYQYKIFGRDFSIWRVTGVVLYIITIWLIALALLHTNGILSAALATTALGLDPLYRIYSTQFMTEGPIMFLLACYIYLVIQLHINTDKYKLSKILLISMILGLMILTRGQYVIIVPFLMLEPMLNLYIKNKLTKINVATFLIPIIIITTPWIVRNLHLSDMKFPLGTMGAINLVEGFSDTALDKKGLWSGLTKENLKFKYKGELSDFENQLLQAKIQQKAALDWIKENPLGSILLGLYKIKGLYIDQAYLYQSLGVFLFILLLLINYSSTFSRLLILSLIGLSISIALTWVVVGGRFLLPFHIIIIFGIFHLISLPKTFIKFNFVKAK